MSLQAVLDTEITVGPVTLPIKEILDKADPKKVKIAIQRLLSEDIIDDTNLEKLSEEESKMGHYEKGLTTSVVKGSVILARAKAKKNPEIKEKIKEIFNKYDISYSQMYHERPEKIKYWGIANKGGKPFPFKAIESQIKKIPGVTKVEFEGKFVNPSCCSHSSIIVWLKEGTK